LARFLGGAGGFFLPDIVSFIPGVGMIADMAFDGPMARATFAAGGAKLGADIENYLYKLFNNDAFRASERDEALSKFGVPPLVPEQVVTPPAIPPHVALGDAYLPAYDGYKEAETPSFENDKVYYDPISRKFIKKGIPI
jgi:hypothetical protein